MGRPRLSERDKLSKALTELHRVLGAERGVVRGAQLKNATRVLLLGKGFLREILKGWYFVSDPAAGPGDTTPFYANFWEYLASYLSERFGEHYCLTAEHSLLRHAQYNVVPKQVNVMLDLNQSQIQELAFGHSLAMYPGGKSFPRDEHVTSVGSLRCMSPPYCLAMLPPRAFQTYAREVQIVLGTLDDPGAIAALVDVNARGIGRVISASRLIGRHDFADSILRQLSGFNLNLPTEEDPFKGQPAYRLGPAARSPLHARVRMLWARHRDTVLGARPEATARAIPAEAYLQQIEALKVEDAYHSLSIERYRVTPELIRKVAEARWSPETNPEDKQQIEAMAARGYLDTFALVKADAGSAFTEEPHSPGTAARLFADRHQEWFQKLFGPSVDAGILERRDLVGYRRHMVFLRVSLHSPPHFDHVRDGMAALMECLEEEPDAFVRAVLGHWLFGFIHPFMDGNGRMARFTMNLMLASGGYPWTVIRVDDRQAYLAALESASVEDTLMLFATFVASCVRMVGPLGLEPRTNGL